MNALSGEYGTRAQSELVSSIVPRGTSLRWIVVLSLRQFGVRRSDCRRHFPCPAELGSITPHAMHNHGEPPCQCDDGFFLPPTLGNVHRPMPSATTISAPGSA